MIVVNLRYEVLCRANIHLQGKLLVATGLRFQRL